MAETFSSVPRVDYSRLKDPTTSAEELAKLREAIFVVGFLYLTNTGLEVQSTFGVEGVEHEELTELGFDPPHA